MGEQHPAAATARAYVELIGDLPWRQTASTLAGAGHRLKSLEEIRIALDQGHKATELAPCQPAQVNYQFKHDQLAF